MFHVLSNQDNHNGKCANLMCGFKFRKMFPAAKYFHTSEKSWVCTACAQAINREKLSNALKYDAKYAQVCITSEDMLVLKLIAGSQFPEAKKVF